MHGPTPGEVARRHTNSLRARHAFAGPTVGYIEKVIPPPAHAVNAARSDVRELTLVASVSPNEDPDPLPRTGVRPLRLIEPPVARPIGLRGVRKEIHGATWTGGLPARWPATKTALPGYPMSPRVY